MACPETDRTLAWIDGSATDSNIEAHVARCKTCSDLARSRGLGLRATVLDSDPAEMPQVSEPPATTCFAIGAFVAGRYRIVRFIARGGMGEVYEAFDEELRVRVALKAATRTTGVALDRFRREVMLARRVTHRNVCRLYEIGFEADVPYCTMELLEGPTLSDRIERGPLAIADARAIVEQIAAGLDAAHEVGVIHRDFKSTNIMLVGERAVISDFGLARAGPGVTDDGSKLTHEEALIGTPAYMAPEQVESKPATPATDIYALGVVMFEMLTGELPFRASTPMATAVMRLKQPAPSARDRRPDLPAAWDKVIARCLEIDPARRFQRANEVVAALPHGAPPRRRRTLLAAGVAAATAAIAVVSVVAMSGGDAPVAALPAAAADGTRTVLVVDPSTSGDAWRATAIGELMRGELRVANRVRIVDGNETARLLRETQGDAQSREATARLASATPAQILVSGTLRDDTFELRWTDLATGRELGADRATISGELSATELGARMRRVLAGLDISPDADRAVKVLPSTLDAARAYADGLARARALDHRAAIAALVRATELAPEFAPAYVALYDELVVYRLRARAAVAAKRAFELAGGLRSDQRLRAEASYRASRKEWRLAAELWSTLLVTEPDDVVAATALAAALSADHQVERCFTVLDDVRRRPPPVGVDPRLDLQEASCAREAGDFRRGLSAATRADIRSGVRGAIDLQAKAMAIEGEMLANAGEYDRAIVMLGRAKQLHASVHDGEGVFEATRQLAFVLGEQGNNVEAERADREALQLAREMGDRIGEGIIHNDLGQILPRPEDALALFRAGLAIAREQGDDRLVTALLLNIANKQDETGNPADAIVTYREVIERTKAQQDDENLATAEMNMGNSLAKLGKRDEALPLFDEALASYRRRGDEDGVGYALASRGDLQHTRGDFAAARADLEASLALRLRLGEQKNAAKSQEQLARLDVDEDRAAEAEPLARAALAERRRENDPKTIAGSLIILAEVLVAVGKPRDALAALAEAERTSKPSEAPDELVGTRNIAIVRALADPANAAAQLAIVHASGQDSETILVDAMVELALGHTVHAKALLADVVRRARAEHAGDVAARATRLLAR